MDTYRKIMLSLATMALAASPSAMAVGYADMNTVGGYGPYQTGQGGEFTFRIGSAQTGSGIVAGTGEGSTWSFYDPLTRDQVLGASNQPSFQTFCVEGSEYVYSNTAFDATTSQSTHAEGHTLTVGAAWLYTQFASGQLAGYNYGAGRTTTAADLQRTIWWLMGTEGYSQTLAAAPANVYTTLVMGTFTGDTLFDANAGQYGVAVLRLWADGDMGDQLSGNRRQDQLILTGPVGSSVPTPDGGFTLALLGISLTGLAAFRRRFRPAS